MNCIIIDDEATARNILIKLCAEVNSLTVKKEFDNATDALMYLESNKVDFIFLDLHMPSLNGYEFIEVLKKPIHIVLTTTDRGSAIKAFEYKSIIDYLGKPFELPRLIHALDKVNKAIKIKKHTQNKSYNNLNSTDLFVNVQKKITKIALKDINFIKSYQNGIKVYTENKDYVLNSSLCTILEKVPNSVFLRVHQSYIVNISKIENIENGKILINKERIPVSKMRKPVLMKRINLI